jgi:hypothetical protein
MVMKLFIQRFFGVFLIILAFSFPGIGQVAGEHTQRFFFDFSLVPGITNQQYTAIPLSTNYYSAVNEKEGALKYTNGQSLTYDMQFGFYLTKKRRLALSVGFMYQVQQGNLRMDTFHVEYQSTDYKKNIFRQVISSVNPITESAVITNISVPVLLKYKIKLSKKFFIALDAGVLFNVLSQNNYKSNARFDYEAIYQFGGTGSNLTYIYDNGSSPGGQDWLITKKEFIKDNPKGNPQDYFTNLKSIGYNVGLNQGITNKTGTLSYAASSIGYMVLPTFNYRLTENIIFNVGFSYSSQLLVNPESRGKLLLTNNMGDYTSLMNFVKNVQSSNYGISLGVSFYINSYVDKTYDHPFNVKLHK